MSRISRLKWENFKSRNMKKNNLYLDKDLILISNLKSDLLGKSSLN